MADEVVSNFVLPALVPTFGGDIAGLFSPTELEVDSVHHAVGNSPGIANLRLPTKHFSGMPDTNGATVEIFLAGARIFAGRVMRASYSVGENSFSTDLFALDDRAALNRTAIGDPGHPDFPVLGWNVAFNQGGKADKKPGEAKFARYTADAEWWTLLDILTYIGEEYIERYSSLGFSKSDWSSLDGQDEIPGEVVVGGRGIGSAFDEAVGLFGDISWGVDYTSLKVLPVGFPVIGPTRTITYITVPAEVGPTFSPSFTVSLDATRGRNRSVAVSANLQTEASWSTEDGTLILSYDRTDRAWSGMARVYKVNGTRTDPKLGPALAENDPGREWSGSLLTRIDSPGNPGSYVTAAEHQAATNRGEPVPDNEAIWVKDKGQPSPFWEPVYSGVEIQYDPPALRVMDTITVRGEGASQGENREIAVTPDADLEFLITTVTGTDINESSVKDWGNLGAAFVYPYDFNLYIRKDDLVPEYRLGGPYFPAGTNTAPGRVPEGWYYDPNDTLKALTDRAGKQTKRVLRELMASLPYPLYLNLGDQIVFVPSDGGDGPIDPNTDPLICTGLDWYFGERQTTEIRAENQFGDPFFGIRPAAQRDQVIKRWKTTGLAGAMKAEIAAREKALLGPFKSPRRFGKISGSGTGFRGPRRGKRFGVLDSPSTGFRGRRAARRFGKLK